MEENLERWVKDKLEEGVDEDLLIEVLIEKKGLDRSEAEGLVAEYGNSLKSSSDLSSMEFNDNYKSGNRFSRKDIKESVSDLYGKKIGYFLVFIFAIFGLLISGNSFEIINDDTEIQNNCEVSFDAELKNIEDVDLIDEGDNLDFMLKPEIEGSDSIKMSFVFTRTFNGFEGGVERYTPENNTVEIEDGEEFHFEQQHEELNLFKYDYLTLIPEPGSETCSDFSERFSIPHLN